MLNIKAERRSKIFFRDKKNYDNPFTNTEVVNGLYESGLTINYITHIWKEQMLQFDQISTWAEKLNRANGIQLINFWGINAYFLFRLIRLRSPFTISL
jgi:hypothetical protein